MAGQGGFATRLNGTINFAVSSTSNTSFTAVDGYIGEVTSISLPELGVTDIDVSSFDSAQNYMEFVGGSIDPGVIDIELNYDADETDDLIAAINDANEEWQLTFPDGSYWRGTGYINKVGGGTTAPNDKISSVASIKMSGIPTHSTTFLSPGA
jgi:hypothetical protein